MANIQFTSRFKPFSYAEMIASILAAETAHREVEDAYAALEEKASIWDLLANEENDPIAYLRLKAYARKLAERADELSKRGLTPNSRRLMSKLKAEYGKEILPIELAYARRKELLDELRKAILNNPTLMFLRNLSDPGYNSSLDRFVENPQYDYGKSYSGALLTSQVATAAAALAKEFLLDYKNGDTKKLRAKLESIGLSYQYRLLEQLGFDSNAVMAAIANDPNANKVLTGIVDNVIQSSGIPSWADSETMNLARAYANLGLWNAVGQQLYRYLTDSYGMLSALLKQALNPGEGIGFDSFLLNSGLKEKHWQALLGLRAGKDGTGVASAYFGKKGNIDPTKVYELYWAAVNAAKMAETGSTIGGPDAPKLPYYRKASIDKINSGLAAANRVLERHGVTKVITKEQYDALKAIGLNPNQTRVTKFSLISDAFDNLVKENFHYWTDTFNYDWAEGLISSLLSNFDINDLFEGKVYRVNTDGSRGKGVRFNEILLKGYDPENPSKGSEITNIGYNPSVSNMILVKVKGKGVFYMVPGVLGGAATRLVELGNAAILNGDDKALVGKQITALLNSLINSYNLTRSTSNSNI